MYDIPMTGPENQFKTFAEKTVAAPESLIARGGFHTICSGSTCPNIDQCYSQKRATFMILGNRCTRQCSFCDVLKGMPLPPDPDEPLAVAGAVRDRGLRHIVIASPTRDDLPDGGAEQFARTVEAVKAIDRNIVVELLIPDLREEPSALATIASSGADIVAHNLETVPRLFHTRKGGAYERSIRVLGMLKRFNPSLQTKSGIMLGLGESIEEVLSVMRDLLAVQCRMLSIGQYVPPSNVHHAVAEYVEPSYFEFLRKQAETMGFLYIKSSPYTRRSYMIEDAMLEG